jgi:peroxiredoxin
MTSSSEHEPGNDASTARPAGEIPAPKAERGRSHKIVAGAIILSLMYLGIASVLGVVWVGGLFSGPGAADLEGAEAPAFTLPVYGDSGQSTSLAEATAEHDLVLLDFWATWCKPCARQMSTMKTVLAEQPYRDRVGVLAVNTQRPSERRRRLVSRYVRVHDLPFPVLMDDGSVKARYGVSGIPTTVLVDPKGRVVHASTGAHSADELRSLLDRHLPPR